MKKYSRENLVFGNFFKTNQTTPAFIFKYMYNFKSEVRFKIIIKFKKIMAGKLKFFEEQMSLKTGPLQHDPRAGLEKRRTT